MGWNNFVDVDGVWFVVDASAWDAIHDEFEDLEPANLLLWHDGILSHAVNRLGLESDDWSEFVKLMDWWFDYDDIVDMVIYGVVPDTEIGIVMSWLKEGKSLTDVVSEYGDIPKEWVYAMFTSVDV